MIRLCRFEALTRELAQLFEADHDRARLIVRELLDNPDGLRKLLAENLRPWVLLSAQYLRQGQGSELIHKVVDPEAYVLHVTMLVMMTIATRAIASGVLGDVPGQLDGYARQLNELIRLSRTGLFVR